MPSMKSAFMFNYCILSCSFEKMIGRQNRLKALKLKNVAECVRNLLGPIQDVSIIDYFTFAKVHYARQKAGHEFPLKILAMQFERTYLLFL